MKKSILLRADETIHGERVKTYGPATDTFQRAAYIMTQLTRKPFTPEDIAKVQIIMKLIRNEHSPTNEDHVLDLCGYAGILSDLQQKENCLE